MSEISLDQLDLSVRAKHVLHRMGVHTYEQLIVTPIEEIAIQRNMGVKTLEEIKSFIRDYTPSDVDLSDSTSSTPESTPLSGFTDEQMKEMSQHSIDELHLSVRPYNAIRRAGFTNIDQVASLSDFDLSQIKGMGIGSAREVKESFEKWTQENLLCFTYDELDDETETKQKAVFQIASEALSPLFHIYWKELSKESCDDTDYDEIYQVEGIDALIQIVLQMDCLKLKLERLLQKQTDEGIIEKEKLLNRLNDFDLPFSAQTIIDAGIKHSIICEYEDYYLIVRERFIDAFSSVYNPDDRTDQILQFRVEGCSLQDIGELYDLTRERVRQIAIKRANKFPPLFEDYFSDVYSFFHISKNSFIDAFPEVSEEGYEYLSTRYQKGKTDLSEKTIQSYYGKWKSRLIRHLEEEIERRDKQTISRTEMIMRVLISNKDTPLSIEEFEDTYYEYLKRKGFSTERLTINMRSVGNHLRNAKGVVFNRENKVRYCDADPHVIWNAINFSQYKNSVISSELIFRDYNDLMEELDIRDGYELFYVIKSSLSLWNKKLFEIKCRRVPVIVMGEASEEAQAIKLLREISPVAYYDYYLAYEERYGLRKETAQGNPTISNALARYYVDGQYLIDAPVINDADVPAFLSALNKKTIWFIDEIELLFDTICINSSKDAINEAAFRRIGYVLYAGYAFSERYGTVNNYLETEVFSADVVDLNTLDRRLLNLSSFGSFLDKTKKALDFIETAPKVLTSIKRINEAYGLTKENIREIQSNLTEYYKIPYFNGFSLWSQIENQPLIQKLQKNDWMLTCILRQQDIVSSMIVGGGIILSLDNESLSISKICEWIASIHNKKMPLKTLEKEFNSTFGSKVSSSKLAEKLKSSGSWDRVVSDSMDEYIDQLVDTDIANMDTSDLFQEEFF